MPRKKEFPIKDTSKKIQKCSRCKKQGHTIRSCPKKNTPITVKKCAVCCNVGHNKRSCPFQYNCCAKCHRVSSFHHVINLVQVPINHLRRSYGDTVANNDKVCENCYRYVHPDSKNPTWSDAWPSCIYSLLMGKLHKFEASVLLDLLPISIRSMYEPCKYFLSQEMQRDWSKESAKFLDVTLRVKTFKDRIEQYKIGALRSGLNDTAYPVGLCPQGCNLYPEEDFNEIKYLPVSHWLAFHDEEFTSFGADPKIFIGKRPAWPRLYKQLGFRVGAVLLINDEHGFVMVACSDKVHADGTSLFVHLVPHPHGNMSYMNNDVTAPVAMVPNISREAKTTKYNASSTVFKEFGSPEGIASFGLITNVIFNPQSLGDRMLILLALDSREDIRETFSQDGGPFKSIENMNDVLEEYRDKFKPPEREIAECLSDGTTISKQDAIHLQETYIKAKSDESRMGKRIRDESIEMVHTIDNRGCHLFSMEKLAENCKGTIDAALYIIVSALLHCRLLLSLFCDGTGNKLLRNSLQKLCVQIKKGTDCRKNLSTVLQRLTTCSTNWLTSGDAAYCAAELLSEVNREIHAHHLNSTFAELSTIFATATTDIIIVSLAMIYLNVPKHLDNGKWVLHYAAGYSKDYKMYHASRWSAHKHWQYSDGKESSAVLKKKKYTFLIYLKVRDCSMNRGEYLNLSGGQSKLKCADHSDFFMQKENARKTSFQCQILKCKNKLGWRCSHGFGGVITSQCCVGVCNKHGKSILQSEESGIIKRKSLFVASKSFPDEDDSSSQSSASEFETENDTSDPYDREETDVFGAGDYIFDDDQEIISTSTSVEDYANDEGFVSGHYLIRSLSAFKNKLSSSNISVKWHKMLSYIHSITKGVNLPLLFPETLLFPKIFWAWRDGTPVGGLPAVFYTRFMQESQLGGFASLKDHLRIRLCNQNLLTARDRNYIAWSFDCYINSILNNHNTAIAMTKGFEYITRDGIDVDNMEFRLPYDEVDSRKQVSRLSSMMRFLPWSMFITLTCNISATMGIWPIKRALEEEYGVGTVEFDLALQNYCTIICRSWAKTIKYFFQYLVHSKEDILGDVDSYYVKTEWQTHGSPGNFPHTHAGLSLKKNSKYTKEDLCQKIHNKIIHIFNTKFGTDYESLLKRGIVKDRTEFASLYQLAEELFVHDCKKARYACMSTKSDGSKYCRVPIYTVGHEAKEKVFDNVFERKFLDLLCKINMAKKVQRNGETIYTVDDLIKCSSYDYPKEPGLKSVPTNGEVFSVFRSMINAQVCSRKMSSAYLAKYVTKLAAQNNVLFSRKNGSNEINVEDASKKGNAKISPTFREVGFTEMIWKLLDLPYVMTNVKFVHYSTHSPECRYYIKKRFFSGNALRRKQIQNLLRNRQAFPNWRKFTDNQEHMIEELSESNFNVDKTTSFSIRPPELLFVMKVELYLRYFITDTGKFKVDENLEESSLVDGLGRRVRVRIIYLTDVIELLQSMSDMESERVNCMLNLFTWVSDQVNLEVKSPFFEYFVDLTETSQVVPVMTMMDVQVPYKFLVHVLISLGSFETEFDLFMKNSLYEAFVEAKLIDQTMSMYNNWQKLCEKYVRTQSVYLPLNSTVFPKKVIEATQILKQFIYKEVIDYPMPLCMEAAMKAKASEELTAMLSKKRIQLLHVLAQLNLHDVPSLEDMKKSRVFQYKPKLLLLPQQSSSSYGEQLLALERFSMAVDRYCNSNETFIRFPLLIGPPGAGKTHLLLMACLYAVSKGLTCEITAVTGERARILGGEHLHSLFGIPVKNNHSVHLLASSCMSKLTRRKMQLAYLKQLDCLIIEEIGLLPSHLLNLIDFVLRTIRNSTKPFGGILILSCGDHKQLKPVDGRTIWMGTECLIQFEIIAMKNYVRCLADGDLQYILGIFRTSSPSIFEIENVVRLIEKRCSKNCVESWDEVPSHYFRVVSKVDSTISITDKYVEKKMQEEEHFVSQSFDETKIHLNQWVTCNEFVRTRLNKLVKEPSRLVLFVRAIMRLTYNNRKHDSKGTAFNQGQLCVVLSLPDPGLETAKQVVSVKLVPPGIRVMDVNNLPDQWPVLELKRRIGIECEISHESYARRQQFPLTYYVCNTIHKSMGETIPYVATKIECNGAYSVWERNQVLVLLSRVQTLSNLMFVGDIGTNLKAVRKVLEMVDPLDKVVDSYLNKCNVLTQSDRFIPQALTMKMGEIIPSTPCGYVYLMVSSKCDDFRIGVCESLHKELQKYNSLHAQEKLKFNQPWCIVCYLYGFNAAAQSADRKSVMMRFKDDWQQKVAELNIKHPKTAVENLKSLLDHRKSDAGLSDVIIKELVSFYPTEKDSDFIAIQIHDSDNGVNTAIGTNDVSALEKVPQSVYSVVSETVDESILEVMDLSEGADTAFVSSLTSTMSDVDLRTETIVCAESADQGVEDVMDVSESASSYNDALFVSSFDSTMSDGDLRNGPALVDVESGKTVDQGVQDVMDVNESASSFSDTVPVSSFSSMMSNSVPMLQEESPKDFCASSITRPNNPALCFNENFVAAKVNTMSNSFVRHEIESLTHGQTLDRAMYNRIVQLTITTPGDGHCLFYALVKSMSAQFGHTIEVNTLIQDFETEFTNNFGRYRSFLSCGPEDANIMLRAYVDNKDFNSVLGDIAPFVLANVLKRKIGIFNLINGSIIVNHMASQTGSRGMVYIYRRSNHYEGLKKLNSP